MVQQKPSDTEQDPPYNNQFSTGVRKQAYGAQNFKMEVKNILLTRHYHINDVEIVPIVYKIG